MSAVGEGAAAVTFTDCPHCGEGRDNNAEVDCVKCGQPLSGLRIALPVSVVEVTPQAVGAEIRRLLRLLRHPKHVDDGYTCHHGTDALRAEALEVAGICWGGTGEMHSAEHPCRIRRAGGAMSTLTMTDEEVLFRTLDDNKSLRAEVERLKAENERLTRERDAAREEHQKWLTEYKADAERRLKERLEVLRHAIKTVTEVLKSYSIAVNHTEYPDEVLAAFEISKHALALTKPVYTTDDVLMVDAGDDRWVACLKYAGKVQMVKVFSDQQFIVTLPDDTAIIRDSADDVAQVIIDFLNKD